MENQYLTSEGEDLLIPKLLVDGNDNEEEEKVNEVRKKKKKKKSDDLSEDELDLIEENTGVKIACSEVF